MLILTAIVVWFGLCLLLAAGTIFLQNYLFESPPLVKDVVLRALAGGTLIGLFYGFWILRASANPLRFAPLMEFSATEPAKEFPKMKAVIDGRVTDVSFNRYDKRYFTMQGKPMPERPEAIIVTEDGTDVKFTPDRSSTTAGQSLKYRDDKGREMDSISLGSITTRHPGWAFGYFILTVVHFLVWLAALWPIMRYGPGYSCLIAVIAWLVGSLVVLPPLIAQAKKVHDREAGVKTALLDIGRQQTTQPKKGHGFTRTSYTDSHGEGRRESQKNRIEELVLLRSDTLDLCCLRRVNPCTKSV